MMFVVSCSTRLHQCVFFGFLFGVQKTKKKWKKALSKWIYVYIDHDGKQKRRKMPSGKDFFLKIKQKNAFSVAYDDLLISSLFKVKAINADMLLPTLCVFMLQYIKNICGNLHLSEISF